jgi:hypothetical protein
VKTVKRIPFKFVLEELEKLRPLVRPMFGCYAVYVGDKIMLIIRDKGVSEPDDGVWIATQHEHHDSLRKMLPSLQSIRILGESVTKWQNIPKNSLTFEEEVMKVCEMILRSDPRIGNVPTRKKKSKPTRKR